VQVDVNAMIDNTSPSEILGRPSNIAAATTDTCRAVTMVPAWISTNKVAVVTGASRGISLAIALVESGATVVRSTPVDARARSTSPLRAGRQSSSNSRAAASTSWSTTSAPRRHAPAAFSM
jgi:hypothetical protein